MLVGSLCAGLVVAAVVITLGSPIVDEPALYASLRGFMGLGLLVVGLYGWALDPGARYPVLLLTLCCLAGLTSLTGVDDPWLFTLGRIATAATTITTVYVFLAYPDGRIREPPARKLVTAGAGGTALLLALSLVLSQEQPVAGPFVRCSGDCPENPLALAGATAGMGRASTAALGLLTAAITAGAAVLLARRMRSATALERRSIGPVLAWAALVAGGYAVYVAVRVVDDGSVALAGIGTVIAVTIALIPAALAVGLVSGRVFAASALRRTVVSLGERPSPAGLRDALAGSFRDPALRLVFWAPTVARYVDELGRPAEMPEPGARTAFTRFDRDGEPVAAAIHDRALSDDPGALQAAGNVL
ncbi:MAG TPA: hypothetical protein VGF25_14215, partial [Thermoleophilaceae bacterium]